MDVLQETVQIGYGMHLSQKGKSKN